MDISTRFEPLGLSPARLASGDWAVRSPIDGAALAHLALDDAAQVDATLAASVDAFDAWRRVPAPRRGELVRRFGEALRAHKSRLGALVTLESGKILSEGEGEVQEMID
ncbi:MAG: aldehyde dehydrogenase family protein, partial [Rhodocyclaceae bacterium]|nr:aldehyde dehydrogenase family protein [Rhodocyclaceae bacterium]